MPDKTDFPSSVYDMPSGAGAQSLLALEPVYRDERQSLHLERWRNRALAERYALLFIDSVPVRVKDRGLMRNRRLHLALGVAGDGTKDILACWPEDPESVSLWSAAMASLKARGLRHCDIAVVEDCAAASAMASAFPSACVRAAPGRAEDQSWPPEEALPPMLTLLCNTMSATDSTVEKRRRRGLVKRYTFASIEAAMRDLVLVLEDANASWKVSPQRWAEARKELALWRHTRREKQAL